MSIFSLEDRSKPEEEGIAIPAVPSYLLNADIHNVANKNESFLMSPLETASNATKFVAASLVSGANQLYNIVPTVANWFGADMEQSKAEDVMRDLDDDLAKYYMENQSSTDVAGFIISSFVPGIGGIKLANAGQKMLQTAATSGKWGKGMEMATGLLAPQREKYLSKAIAEIGESGSIFTKMSTNTLNAIKAGYHQAALESAAFEVAVAATLNQSPVLEKQDIGDYMYNIGVGTLLGGGIGGAISHAMTSGAIKKTVAGIDESINIRFRSYTPDVKELSHGDMIAKWLDDVKAMPTPTTAAEKAAYDETVGRVNNLIRGRLGKAANGDQQVADDLLSAIRLDTHNGSIAKTFNLSEAVRMGEKSEVDKLAARLTKNKEAALGALDAPALPKKQVYLSNIGENAGQVVDEAPTILKAVDTLKPGEKVTVSGMKVQAGNRTIQFTTKSGVEYDVAANSHINNELRMAWAMSPSTKIEIGHVIGENDIPLLTRAFMDGNHLNIGVKLSDGNIRQFSGTDEFLTFLSYKKQSIATELVSGTKKVSQAEAAKMVDAPEWFLNGEIRGSLQQSMFATHEAAKAYTARMVAAGLRKEADGLVDIVNVPSFYKLSYNTEVTKDLNGHVLDGISAIMERQRIARLGNQTAAATVLGEDASRLVDITHRDVIETANRYGSGPGMVSSASANYGTLGSTAEYLGKTTLEIIGNAKGNVRTTLEPVLHKLANKPEAAVEFSTLMQRLRMSPEHYVVRDGELVLEKIAKFDEVVAAGSKAKPPVIDPSIPHTIPIQHPETLETIMTHAEMNGARRASHNTLRGAKGVASETEHSMRVYPPAPNPKDYPYIAFVTDDSITGMGHHKMLYAQTEKELEAQMAAVKQQFPEFQIRTKKEAEDYFKAQGKFSYDETLSENYIDVALKRKGVSAPFLIKTDPQKIADDLLNWHLDREAFLVRDAVSTHYAQEFDAIRNLGYKYEALGTSRYGGVSMVKYAEGKVPNPYMDYIKTSLGINTANEFPFWMPLQKMLDSKVSQLVSSAQNYLVGAKKPQDLDALNQMLQNAGYKGAYYDSAMALHANMEVPRGALQSFVTKANAILATLTLRLDPINALNNTVGFHVLYGAETRSILKAIERQDAEAVGALAKIKVPGTTDSVLAPGKLFANAFQNFRNPEIRTWARENGFLTSLSEQYSHTLDNLALTGKESVKGLDGKIAAAMKWIGDNGEKITGNKLAEEFNRFVAADTMRQITDVAVSKGILTKEAALPYINSFINRVNGNHIAAQRPMLFQGPVGNAIGLFQTYQFTLLQNMFRHVSEGSAKDAAMLLGLQGTIYGMNGLPAFNAINTHIIGNASGNTNHRDMYDVVYGAAGKEGGDWLMYGFASNMMLHPDLKINLYTRGDINPRHVTVVPTDPASVPIVQATAKFFGNMVETVKKINAGGDVWGTILQGIEHNGVSRPLAGMAQVLEASNNPMGASFSTSNKGNVIMANDLLSLANGARILGAKPLDEAITTDAAFRFTSYAAHDSAERKLLGEAIKTTVIAGKEPSEEQIAKFASEYAARGGKQTEFNKFMFQQIRNANTSQVNSITSHLQKPYAQSVQKIMGNYQIGDFSNNSELGAKE